MTLSPGTISNWDRFEAGVLDWSPAWGPKLALLRERREPFTVRDLGPSPDPRHPVTHVLAIALAEGAVKIVGHTWYRLIRPKVIRGVPVSGQIRLRVFKRVA